MNNDIFSTEYQSESEPTSGISRESKPGVETIDLIISEPLAKPHRKIIKAQIISE